MTGRKKTGFTLIEVLITIALFALLMTMASSAIIHSVRFYAGGNELAKLRARTSLVLDVIATDIAAASDIYSPSIYNSPVSSIKVGRYDIFRNDTDPSNGGILTVTYQFDPSGAGVIRRSTVYDSTILAEGVRSLTFTSFDSAQAFVSIDITLLENSQDPAAKSFQLSTSVCRKAPLDIWKFGP